MESQLLSISPKAKLLKVDWGKNPKDYQAAPIKITFWYEIPDYAIIGNDEMALVPLTMHGLYDQVRSYLRIDTDIPNVSMDLKTAVPFGGTGRDDSVTSGISSGAIRRR